MIKTRELKQPSFLFTGSWDALFENKAKLKQCRGYYNVLVPKKNTGHNSFMGSWLIIPFHLFTW